jgi:hypothetical protein
MTNDCAKSNGVKILVYGNSGVGKTLLSSTLPSPVLISAESGILSLKKENIEKVFGKDVEGIIYDIPVVNISSMEDLEEVYTWAIENKDKYETLVLDSLTEIGEVVLANAKKVSKDPRMAYGEMMTQMESIIRSFRDIEGKNICMICKAEPIKDEFTGVIRFCPSMPGNKLGQKLPYFFDEVFRLGINSSGEKSYRFIQTQPDFQYEAKDRSGSLESVEEPNLGVLINKIIGD